MLLSFLHPFDEKCHISWLTFNASLSQTVLEVLLRDDLAKQLHNSSWKIFAGEGTDHSSQLANWCFMKITSPYPWRYICPVHLERFIWHLNYEFLVWGSISIVETFYNSPGVWQECWVLWVFFVAPTLWTVFTVGEHFPAPCSVLVSENILFTSSSSLPHHTQHILFPSSQTHVVLRNFSVNYSHQETE